MTADDQPTRLSSKRPIVAFIIFTGLFITGFYPSLIALHGRWASLDEAYSHGYLLVALALYLFSQSNEKSRHLPLPTRSACTVALAALSLLWFFLLLAGLGVIAQLTLPLIVFFALGAVFGRQTMARALVPVGMLYLAIPIWDELLTQVLQTLSTHISAAVVRGIFGIPTSIDGFHVRIPAGNFEIQGGCSGLVFLLTATTLGIAYGQLMLHRLRSRILCLAVAMLLGLVVNWIRISALIVIGQASSMRSPLIGEGHLMFGFYVFAAVALVTIYVASRFMPSTPANDERPAHTCQTANSQLRPAAVLVMLLGPLLLGGFKYHLDSPPPAADAHSLGPALQATPSPDPHHAAGAAFDNDYRYPNAPAIGVHVIYYRHPFGDGKLISQKNSRVPADAQSSELGTVAIKGHGEMRASIITRSETERTLQWSGYLVGGKLLATTTQARLALIGNALHFRVDGAFVTLRIPCLYVDCALSDQQLAQHAPIIVKSIEDGLSSRN